MPLISSFNQTSSNPMKGADSQKPASQSGISENKAKGDFDKLLDNELPKTKNNNRGQASDKPESKQKSSKDQKVNENTSERKKSDQTEESTDSSVGAEQNEVSELQGMLETQANWKAKGGTQKTAEAEHLVAAAARNTSGQIHEVVTTSQVEQKTTNLTDKMAQRSVHSAEDPGLFRQDSYSENIDPEGVLALHLKAGEKGTKTSLDIQQLITRLNVPHSQPEAAPPQATYVHAQVASAQAIASAQGSVATAATQARPEAQPSLQMLTDPEWPEDLGQRLLRMSQGENGIKEVSLRLDPPSLGTLDIRLKIDENSLSVHFQSSSPQVRELLQNQSDRLRANLGNSNMNLVDVDVSSGQEQKRQHASGQPGTWHNDGVADSSSGSDASTTDSFEERSSRPGSVSSNLFFSTYA